jgi:septum formation protein
MRLILASKSPRRKELLSTLGIPFEVLLQDELIDERELIATSSDVREAMRALAVVKGTKVANKVPDAFVLSADTEVVIDGRALGKPDSPQHASRMLRTLSGREHGVVTALSLQSRGHDFSRSVIVETRVFFNTLDDETIARYVERTMPLDYAGGYAIQGLGALLVERIEGDYSNVVGLPLGITAKLLGIAGFTVL